MKFLVAAFAVLVLAGAAFAHNGATATVDAEPVGAHAFVIHASACAGAPGAVTVHGVLLFPGEPPVPAEPLARVDALEASGDAACPYAFRVDWPWAAALRDVYDLTGREACLRVYAVVVDATNDSEGATDYECA